MFVHVLILKLLWFDVHCVFSSCFSLSHCFRVLSYFTVELRHTHVFTVLWFVQVDQSILAMKRC